MPQLVDVPDHGIVEFPDGMDDDAIASAIKGQSEWTPERIAAHNAAAEKERGLKPGSFDEAQKKANEESSGVAALRQLSDPAQLASLDPNLAAQDFASAGTTHTSLISLPKPTGDSALAGTTRAVEGAIEGLLDPKTMALMVGMSTAPAAIARVAAAGFGAQAGLQVPGQIEQALHAETTGDRFEAGTNAIINTAFAGLGALGAIKPSVKPAISSTLEESARPLIEQASEPLQESARVTTTGEVPTPEVEAQQMLANMNPRDEQPIIGKDTQPLMQSAGIAGPAIYNDSGIISKGHIGQSHADLKAEQIKNGNVDAADAEHGFHVAGSEKPLSRTEAAKVALEHGQIDQATFDEAMKRSEPGLASQDLRVNPANPPNNMKLGGGEAGALNFDVIRDAAAKLKEIPGAKEYAEGWKSRVDEFGKYVDSAKRIIASSEQRDKIPALFDAAETKAGYVADQARSHVDQAVKEFVPDKKIRSVADQAATFVTQAAGDRAGMEAKLDAIRGKGYDDVIDYAKSHWDELQGAADAAKRQTDAVHQAATDSGIDLQYREGYAKGSYDEYSPSSGKVVMDAPKGGGGASSSFTKPKVFNDYAEAIAAGFTPKNLKLSDLTQSAVLNTMRKVNRRQWVTSLGSMEAPDGLAIVRPAERITTTDLGVVSSHGLKAPEGYKLLQIEPGSSVAVHEDFAPLIEKLTTPSTFPKVLAEAAGGVKHNLLAFDIYHGSRFGQMQMGFMRQKTPSFRKGLATMEYGDADLVKAVKSGDITQEQADYAKENRPIIEEGIKSGANIGRISDALFKDVAPLFPYAKATTHFIFDKLSRGIIAESYVYGFKRNAGMHPEMTPEQLHRFTAKEINTYYRNLGNQGLLKNKTFQDTSRFMLLAPQWFEGRLRSEARGAGQLAKSAVTFKKPGNVGAAMGTGLVAYFALNQLVNMATRGHPTWDNPEPGHKLDAWIPDVLGDSSGNFISPLSVFAETTHDAMKLHESGESAADIPADILKSQVGPVPRTLWDLGTGRDFYGQKLVGLDRLTQAAKDIAPVPLVLKGQQSAGSGERQVLSFAGVKSVGAGTASTNTYKLADQWMRANDIKRPGAQEGEHGPASIYKPLRQALEVGDMKKARQQFKELKKTTAEELIDKHFSTLDAVRFTGRKSTEDDFIASLKPKEKRIYERAMQERERVMTRYDNLR